MTKYLICLIFYSSVVSVSAQNDGPVIRHNAGIDRTDYIKSYPDYFFIWPVLKQRKLDFEIKSLSGSKRTLAYKTNKPYSLGLGMYIFEVGAELTFAVPLDEQSKRIYGESKSRDIQLNMLGKKWGIDAYLQRYKGFYVHDEDLSVPKNLPYPQRADIVTRNLGSAVSYTFNNKRFSFRSAYNFSERQLRSAGSFLLFGTLSNLKVEGDSSIIDKSYVSIFEEEVDIQRVSSTVLGVIPGYTYSLIYNGFFLNGTLGLGPAHLWLSHTDEAGLNQHKNKFSTQLAARISLGYNGDRVFGGITFSSQGGNARFENMEMNNSNSSFKVILGYRFKEWGLLTERAIDLPRKFL